MIESRWFDSQQASAVSSFGFFFSSTQIKLLQPFRGMAGEEEAPSEAYYQQRLQWW